MNYERINWENSPSTDTPLDADNLNKMDEGLDTLNREVQKTRADLAKVEESTDVLSARMSTFTTLQEGSTTGDAEIADARNGADGTSYDNLGNSIRGQINKVKDRVIVVSDTEPEEYYNRIWINNDDEAIEIPTMGDLESVVESVGAVRFLYSYASKSELETISKTNITELPDYWVDFLDEKIEEIRGNMQEAGRNGETFAFITDLHWPNNVKNSPRLMFEIFRRLNIHHCICGGDIINEGTFEDSVGVMKDAINAFKHYNIDFLTAVGNHDRNWNIYNNQRSYPERRFSEADVFALIERMSKQVYQNFADDKFENGIGFNMYYDDPITNTRFIIIDINDGIVDPDTGIQGYEFTNYNELADVLHDSNGKHIVIVSHVLGSYGEIGSMLGNIGDALNSGGTISTAYCTADFTGCTGKVHLIIGGHAHSDSYRMSGGGIPIVICDTDSANTHNTDVHIPGTTKEQAFDVVTMNYTAGTVKFVRIGRGADRTFPVT